MSSQRAEAPVVAAHHEPQLAPLGRRDAHLGSIRAPMLFVQGSRDTFGTPDEMRSVVDGCQHAMLHIVDGGDHSLKIRGKSAPPPAEVYDQVQDVMANWIRKQIP